MCEKRLQAFEKMLADVLLRYDSTTEKMAELKAEAGRRRRHIASCLPISCSFRRCCHITGHTASWMMRNNNRSYIEFQGKKI